MTFSFKGHTVVVTGAGGGLGKAYARRQVLKDAIDNRLTHRYSLLFASRGANLVVNDFNPVAAQKVVDEITKCELLPKFRS
jgi:multifunctional beta-oxidation protein